MAFASFSGLRRDLRFSLRAFLRQPGFSLVATATLALGIGATAAVWSVVQAVLLSALPYPDPDRLVMVQGTMRQGGVVEPGIPVSYRDFFDWDQENSAFDALQVYSEARSLNLLAGQEPEHVLGELVSGGYFELLGATAATGRALSPDDDVAGAPPVVVVSHELGLRSTPARGPLVGTSLQINGRPYEVVGVMPPGFKGLTDSADLWLPMAATPSVVYPHYMINRGVRWLNAVARLAPGVSISQAQKDMDRITRNLAEAFANTNEGIGVKIVPLAEAWFSDLRRGLLILLGGAACVLLLACTNVAGLLLARAAARQDEISIRTALGAHRLVLIRQLLTESAVLACAGCLLGLVLAHWGIRLLVANSAVDLRSFVHLGVDLPVIATILGLSALCTFAFGLAPAWLGSRPDLRAALQQGIRGTAGRGRHRFLGSLVVAEVALAIVLLVGAGLLIQGFRELLKTDLGFRSAGLLTLRVPVSGDRYADPAVVRRLGRQLADRLSRLPQVASAALVSPDIPTDDWNASAFFVDGRRDAAADQETYLVLRSVTPGYFRTLGVPIVRGRDFTAADHDRAPRGVVVSQAAADRFWPGQDPLGRRLRIADVDTPWYTVVGVAGDVRHSGLRSESLPGPDVYFALFQDPPHTLRTLNLLIRPSRAETAPLLAGLRREMKAVAPDLPLYDVALLEERLERQTARDRFLTLLLSLFAVLALILAAVGIYGVASYTAAQRRGEIGIRMALGAARTDVFRQTLLRGALLAVAGLAVGIVAALALAPVLSGFLHGVGTSDPLTLLGACLLLLLVVLAANGIPSWRASRVEPAKTLRAD